MFYTVPVGQPQDHHTDTQTVMFVYPHTNALKCERALGPKPPEQYGATQTEIMGSLICGNARLTAHAHTRTHTRRVYKLCGCGCEELFAADGLHEAREQEKAKRRTDQSEGRNT